jgi:hypothetical protein
MDIFNAAQHAPLAFIFPSVVLFRHSRSPRVPSSFASLRRSIFFDLSTAANSQRREIGKCDVSLVKKIVIWFQLFRFSFFPAFRAISEVVKMRVEKGGKKMKEGRKAPAATVWRLVKKAKRFMIATCSVFGGIEIELVQSTVGLLEAGILWRESGLRTVVKRQSSCCSQKVVVEDS